MRGEQKPRKVKLEKTHRVSDSVVVMRNLQKKTVTDVEDMGVALGEKEGGKKGEGPEGHGHAVPGQGAEEGRL